MIVSLSAHAPAAAHKPFKALAVDWLVRDSSRACGSQEDVHAAYGRAFESLNHIQDLVRAILGNGAHLTDETTNIP